MSAPELGVIMPVFNEEESLVKVVDEWIPELKRTAPNFKMYILNDGSKDNTAAIMRELESKHQPFIQTYTHANRGHGQTCITGYEFAIAAGVPWILQIDTDGQCDPKFFPAFWLARQHFPLVFGYRYRRDDGFSRFFISRVLALTCWIGFGTWMKDPNVPYRLMASANVKAALPHVPRDFYLANILLSLLLRDNAAIHWINIRFRDRFGGSPSVKMSSFARHGRKLFSHLVRLRFQK